MKTDELKLKIVKFLESMIDTYSSSPLITDRMLNYTLKILVKNNINKIDSILNMFADENGEVDAECIIHDYMTYMGEEKMTFNIRDYVESPTIKSMLPDRVLVISADDISKIINGF